MIEDDVREVKDRSRRIETRLTKLMEKMGLETHATKPVWQDGFVEVHSISTAIKDILEAIPDEYIGARVLVEHKGSGIGYVIKTSNERN